MKRIALVDDDADHRRTVSAWLGEEFEVLEFEDGFQAIEGLIRCVPDLVLMEISLPGFDGRDVLAHFRRNAEVGSRPVVAVTGDHAGGSRERFLSLGFDGHLAKPLAEPEALLDLVRELLNAPAAGSGPSMDSCVPAELRRAFVQSLSVPLVELAFAIDGVQVGNEDAQRDARKLAHRLKGTGTSFGFPEMTAAGARVGECEGRLELTVALLELIGTVGRAIVVGHGLSPRTALVVGDDLVHRTGMVRPFEALGLTTIPASTLAEGQQRLAELEPEIVVVDAVLPDGQGRELVELASQEPRRSVIVVSGLTSSESKRVQFAAGADFFVDKPIEPRLLCTIMVRAMVRTNV
ncbi:MAG: response regulator [Myxococcota bacterium]